MIALVIGATGLVGTQVVDLLINDERFEKIVIFTRRDPGIQNHKLITQLVDFEKPEDWAHLVAGDVLYSAMGTTLKKAGTKENQYRIDYLYQFQTAQIAVANAVNTLVLVSSAGANEHSAIFYSRMKGELERDVKELGFNRLVIMQPSILDGNRQEKRLVEKISIKIMGALKSFAGIKKYRPIHARIVAQAMINMSLRAGPEIETATLDEIFTQAL
jgi:uncharacterized protein YbjT (DUF2867 family)